MQVNCPNCGAKVAAENINIQKMTAVCSACDTVFSFDLPNNAAENKAKRRKVKQPSKIEVQDGATLQMDFRTNFRLERNQVFLSTLMGGLSSLFVGLTMIGSEGEVPIIMPLVFISFAIVFFYALALTVVNKTHIEMDDDAIRVTRTPLPSLFNQGIDVNLASVTAIKYEETAISKKEGYDTPRYRVWAETQDGSRRTIVNDVIEEYAVFITQRLQERLQMHDEPDVSRLADVERESDDASEYEDVKASQNRVSERKQENSEA
jgi:hypothetical protein